MYIRRVFYDPEDGSVLYVYTQQGDFKYTTPDIIAALIGCPDATCMEWNEPDPEIEAAFSPYDSEGNLRNVSVSVVNGELHFEYSEIKNNDPYEIIDALTGEVE